MKKKKIVWVERVIQSAQTRIRKNLQYDWSSHKSGFGRRDTLPHLDVERRSSAGSFGAGEFTPLLLPKLDKIPTISITSIAEDYHFDPHSIQGAAQKSSYMQSVFNSINILIGIGILSLPLGFKVRLMADFGMTARFACYFAYADNMLTSLVCRMGHWISRLCILLRSNHVYCKIALQMFESWRKFTYLW
jgi:hypothetical protein